jgi:hypothetical protein
MPQLGITSVLCSHLISTCACQARTSRVYSPYEVHFTLTCACMPLQNLNTDKDNCGSCGNPDPDCQRPDFVCNSGLCGCPPGTVFCPSIDACVPGLTTASCPSGCTQPTCGANPVNPVSVLKLNHGLTVQQVSCGTNLAVMHPCFVWSA